MQAILERYIRVRASLAPYILELARNVTARGVPTLRPLWYEFALDPKAVGVDDQYLLGPDYLVAPVTAQGATSRLVYFPAGASWKSFWTAELIRGGVLLNVSAPLDVIPVYKRQVEV